MSSVRSLYDLDESQSQSVYHRSLRKAEVRASDPTEQQWHALVDRQIEELALSNRNISEDQFAHHVRYLNAAKQDPPPDAQTFAGLNELSARSKLAVNAVRRQIDSAAALNATHPHAAEERFHAYREQYKNDYARLPAEERPDPPQEWVEGYTVRDRNAVSSPADKATLYAMYRVQADPNAFPPNPDARYASVDIETAGPAGRSGFLPENGSIIEVGVIDYDSDGNEVEIYEQLIRPSQTTLDTCGTGAVDIHKITVEDVKDSPEWPQVAGAVQQQLNNKIMLAQNARFEKEWLGHHLGTQNRAFSKYGPTVDTMTISNQHVTPDPNNKLSSISNNVGVPYTDGHRALHDARVAGQVFFALKKRIKQTYLSNPVRAADPQPPAGAGIRRKTKQSEQAIRPMTRLSAKDYQPAVVNDPWNSQPT